MTCAACPVSLLCYSGGLLDADRENLAICVGCGQIEHRVEGHGNPPLPERLHVWVMWFRCGCLEQLQQNCGYAPDFCGECFEKRRRATEATTE